jgi:hypothetical protein
MDSRGEGVLYGAPTGKDGWMAATKRLNVEPAPIEERQLAAQDATETLIVRECIPLQESEVVPLAGTVSAKASATQRGNAPRRAERSRESAIEFLTRLTKAEMDTVRTRLRTKAPKYKNDAVGKMAPVGDEVVYLLSVIEAFATSDEDLVLHLLGQLVDTVPYGERRSVCNINFVAAALHSISPRDGLESLLAVQMVGIHNLAMEFLKRAAVREQTDGGLDVNVNRATRCLRTFAIQMEALRAHRSKGQQSVKVEHVHIHRGGKAIVGAVNHTPRGGGE